MSSPLPTYPNHSASDILAELLSRFNAPGGFTDFTKIYNDQIDLVFEACGFKAIQKPIVTSLLGIGSKDQDIFLVAIFFAMCNNTINHVVTGVPDARPLHYPDAVKAFLEHLRDVAKDPQGAPIRTLLIHGNKKDVGDTKFDYIDIFEARPSNGSYNAFIPIYDITPTVNPLPAVKNKYYADWTKRVQGFSITFMYKWCQTVWSHHDVRALVHQIVTDSRFELVPKSEQKNLNYDLDFHITECTNTGYSGIASSGPLYIFLDHILDIFHARGADARFQPETFLSWLKLYLASLVIHEGTHSVLRKVYKDVNFSTPWLGPTITPSLSVKEAGWVSEMYWCAYALGGPPASGAAMPQYALHWDQFMLPDDQSVKGVFDPVRDKGNVNVDFVKWVGQMLAALENDTALPVINLEKSNPQYKTDYPKLYYETEVLSWKSPEHFFLL